MLKNERGNDLREQVEGTRRLENKKDMLLNMVEYAERIHPIDGEALSPGCQKVSKFLDSNWEEVQECLSPGGGSACRRRGKNDGCPGTENNGSLPEGVQ